MQLAVEKEGFHSEHGCMFPVSDIPQEYESSLKPTYYASLAKKPRILKKFYKFY